jgi:hypothetical protein
MENISQYPLAVVKFLLWNFATICLIVGIILLSVNTAQMSKDPNKSPNSTLYTNLNISGIVLLGVFIINSMLLPYIKNFKSAV